MSYLIKQGEDVIIEIPVLDESNNKVALTTATKIRVAFSVKNLEVYKYIDTSLEAAIAGYGIVSVNGTNNYQLDISASRIQTKTFPIGELSASVLIEFPDGILTNKRVEYTYVIGSVQQGILKSEDLTV